MTPPIHTYPHRKTQIALDYAYWAAENCPGLSVFWVHASSAERFRQAFASIAQECHIPGYDDPRTNVLPLVKAWLERKDQGRWLMVIDNADDTQLFLRSSRDLENDNPPDQEGTLGRYIPECPHGSILITTRNKQTGIRLTKGRAVIEVDKMNEDESNRLLRTTLDGFELATDEALHLSSRLECLPLALVQAAAFIRENTVAVSKYLQLLEEGDQNLVRLLSKEFETVGRDSETPHAVTATWIVSFEQIARQNAFAGELLSLMSFFDWQAIPMKFLSHYSEQQQNEGKDDRHKGTEARGTIELEEALGILKAFSFVSVGKDECLDIHRLVQLVTRKWLVKKDTMRQFAGQALLTVSEIYPYGNFENRAICGEYLPHVYAVLKYEGTGSRAENVAKASLLHYAAAFFLYQGQWKDAEKLQTQAVELRRVVLGEEHPLTLTSMGNLASTFSNQGRWKEAELLFVQVVEMLKKVLKEEHPDTLINMGNLASIFSSQGRWKEAESLEVQVMETRKRVLGEEHSDTLTSMANLASTYRSQGRWKEAEELQAKELEICSRVLGKAHPSTLTSMANLASTYRDQGRWKEAESLEVQVMETRKKLLGEKHPLTLTSITNLALTYKDQGRWKEAELLEVQVMETRKRVLGEEHPSTLISMGNLALTYKDQGRWKEAELLEVQVMERRKRVLGEVHPLTLISLANLASTFSNQGRRKEAELLEVQVMETRKRILGEEHPLTLTSMANLASTYRDQGRWKEAESLEVQVMRTRKKVLGEEHPSSLTSMANLALTYKDQGRWKEAESLEVLVMEVRKRILGEEHPHTLTSMNNLAFTWKGQCRNEDAITLMEACLQLRQRILGPHHPHTASTRSALNDWSGVRDDS